MTPNLLVKLDQFYELTNDEQDLVLQQVLEFANANKDQFADEIRASEYDQANHLPIYYEAIAKDLDTWADFFFSEIKRIFDLARVAVKPTEVLMQIDEFAFLIQDGFKYRDELVRMMKKELNNEKPIFRYYAISLLREYLNLNDFNTIEKLRLLLADPDWRIRYWTYYSLKDLGLLNANESLSLMDRLRSSWMNTLKFE